MKKGFFLFILLMSLFLDRNYLEAKVERAAGRKNEYPKEIPQSFEPLMDYLFKRPDAQMVTEAVMVVHQGEVRWSHFEYGGKQDLRVLWSISKSINALILGAMLPFGYVELDKPVWNYLKDKVSVSSEMKKHLEILTLRHLLEMSSGLDWKELYEDDPFNSHVVRMIYRETKKSVGEYILKTDVRTKPGERFYYSSGDTNLINYILKMATPSSVAGSYPFDVFFRPLEMNAVFEKDGEGTFLGSSSIYLNAEDLLKIGQLILDRGRYKNKQILPEWFVEDLWKLSRTLKTNERCLVDDRVNYSFQIWLNTPCPNGKKPYPDLPDDLMMFLGHGGQILMISPKEDLLLLRYGQDQKEEAINRTKFYQLALDGVKKEENVGKGKSKEKKMNAKELKIPLIIGACLILFYFLMNFIFFKQILIHEIPGTLASMRAKDFCSCYFLEEKSEEVCLNQVKKGYPHFSHEIHHDEQKIQFSVLLWSASARILEKKTGCLLE